MSISTSIMCMISPLSKWSHVHSHNNQKGRTTFFVCSLPQQNFGQGLKENANYYSLFIKWELTSVHFTICIKSQRVGWVLTVFLFNQNLPCFPQNKPQSYISGTPKSTPDLIFGVGLILHRGDNPRKKGRGRSRQAEKKEGRKKLSEVPQHHLIFRGVFIFNVFQKGG